MPYCNRVFLSGPPASPLPSCQWVLSWRDWKQPPWLPCHWLLGERTEKRSTCRFVKSFGTWGSTCKFQMSNLFNFCPQQLENKAWNVVWVYPETLKPEVRRDLECFYVRIFKPIPLCQKADPWHHYLHLLQTFGLSLWKLNCQAPNWT